MRRHVATFVAVALILTAAAPVAAVDPATSGPAPEVTGEPAATATPSSAADPTGRWIVLYRAGTDAAASSAKQAKRDGFRVDRTFTHAAKGFTATLTAGQAATLRKDRSVAAVVPDEKIELTAQTFPTGVSRIGTATSPMARIDGLDDRVDADVAIVDTGIATVADLNVVGGYNCSSSDPSAWFDDNGHGTHVAGTVGAIDNDAGVVGVAPGVRLWAVKILNSNGEGLLSWYVCGLDWIAAQRDASDPNRPLFEAVNMSVTKYGRDDHNCGLSINDILHQSICRLVGSGVTVVAAAANDSADAVNRVPASYDEVITVSALADTDGQPGGLGGNRCLSWGGYDKDDTFADFSNYGSDVDLIAPGKCIWSTVPGGYGYSSGTSMAAPHVTGAVALLKATRPGYTPIEVRQALQYLGNLNWNVATDPDNIHEKLLDVSRLGPRGDFWPWVGSPQVINELGGTARFPIAIGRSETFFDRVDLSLENVPAAFPASIDQPNLMGFEATAANITMTVPARTPAGTYNFTVVAREHDRSKSTNVSVVVTNDLPTANAPAIGISPKSSMGLSSVLSRVSWAPATDPSSAIGGYEIQASVDGGPWGGTTAVGPTSRAIASTQTVGHRYQYQVRAIDSAGNWSPWAIGPAVRTGLAQNTDSAVRYVGRWTRVPYAFASGGSLTYATSAGASAKTTFVGRGVGVVGPVGRTRGSARVYVDGVYRTTISFRANVSKSRRVMFSTSFPTRGTHSIQLRLVGNGRVDLDTFIIFR